MTDRDMRPNRFDLMLEYSREFVVEWFDQNPLGQIGIVAMREGIAERICGLTGESHPLKAGFNFNQGIQAILQRSRKRLRIGES